jgi:alanine dehydrogenase
MMSELSDIAKQAMMQPQEAMLELRNKKNNLYIGIPKETSFQENRIALTPLSVGLLVQHGHEVWLQTLRIIITVNRELRSFMIKRKFTKLI